jgi:hypothetical protein
MALVGCGRGAQAGDGDLLAFVHCWQGDWRGAC